MTLILKNNMVHNKTSTLMTDDEKDKMSSSLLKFFADVSCVKRSILASGENSENKILLLKNLIDFYVKSKQEILEESISFDFCGNGLDEENTEKNKAHKTKSSSTKKGKVKKVKFSQQKEDADVDTDSEYEFPEADKNETQMVNKQMAFGMIKLKRARSAKGFYVKKITSNDFSTEFIKVEQL